MPKIDQKNDHNQILAEDWRLFFRQNRILRLNLQKRQERAASDWEFGATKLNIKANLEKKRSIISTDE